MRRVTALDLVLLSVLCAVVFLPGLTAFPVANTQEAFRLLAAQDMQRTGDLLVPTHFGEPYLAKPPFFYWPVIAIAELRGADASLFDLRLTVAIAGWLGVLATYGLARWLFRDPHDDVARSAGLWSAAVLAVGVLAVRSARIGELDIFLIPQVALVVWLIELARRRTAGTGRTHLLAVAGAAAVSVAAVLTKGPVPLAVIVVAAYLPPVITAAAQRRGGWRAAVIAGVAVGLAFGVAAGLRVGTAGEAFGALGMAALGVVVGAALGRASSREVVRATFRDWSRTHPIAVLGLPLVAFWLWGRHLLRVLEPEVVARFREVETTNNLLVLLPESPMHNAGAMLYGVAPLGFLFLLAGAWRPRGATRWVVPAVWCVGGFIVFSTLGKGVPRYLTPLWPAVAILAGGAISALVAAQPDLGAARRLRAGLIGVVVVAGVAQSVWYAAARPRMFIETTPVALCRELRETIDIGAHELIAVDAQAERMACELGRPVRGWYWREFESGRGALAEAGPGAVLIVRGKDDRPARALELLGRWGAEATAIPVEAVWRRRAGEQPAAVIRIERPPTR